jgi:hypothetical protein
MWRTTAGGAATAVLVTLSGLAAAGPAAATPAPSPADQHAGHDAAGHDAAGHEEEAAQPEDHGGHGGEPDAVSDTTRASVLGGFGAVNAAAVGSAFWLRRRQGGRR